MIKKKKKKMTDEEIVIRRKELAKKEKVAATLDCCSDRRKSVGPSAPIAYATSVSPPNEAVAWPRHRYWMANAAAGCPWRSSCKSPRAVPKCKCLITK